MWVDDDRAYSLNEIAINWNAPLVFLLAAANAHAGTSNAAVR
jgi:endoglucanase